MAEVESLAERARRKRREGGHWTVEDERKWIEDHPEDEPKFDLGTLPTSDNVSHEDDLVPDIEPYERTPEDEAIDAAIARVGIVEAYNRWSGKGTVEPGSKREGIKVRCPNPSHPDRNPSAWLNTDKDVWVCGGCGMEGGDKFDIAAWHFGMPVPGYKGEQFPELRRRMASELGVSVAKSITGKSLVASSEPEPDDEPEPDEQDNVVPLTPGDDEESAIIKKNIPPLNWRSLVSGDTFLGKWMSAVAKDDVPEEFYFWQGLQAIGLAIGNGTMLEDSQPVRGNLFLVLVGGTGTGKSKSVNRSLELLRKALPYDDTDPTSTGTKVLPNIASSEALVDAFVRIEQDDAGTTVHPVRGLVKYGELAELISKAARMGNPIKETLMDLYDSTALETRSRGHGHIFADNAFGSAITTTQGGIIRETLRRTDAISGFANRWVYVIGTPKEYMPFGGGGVNLEEAAAALRGLRAFYSTKDIIEYMDEAQAYFAEWARTHIAPLKKKDDDDSSMMARIDLTIKKLILLLAVDRRERAVTLQTVKDAINFWDLLESSYRYVTSEMGSGPARDAQKRIIEVLDEWDDKRERGPSARDIIRAAGPSYDLTLMKNVLKTMVELGLVNEGVYKPKRGPSTVTYTMVKD